MGPFHGPILRRLARVDQIMDDAALRTEQIERMHGLGRHVGTVECSGVSVREHGSVVRLDRLDRVREPGKDLFEKPDRIAVALLVIHGQMPPARGAVDGRILEIPLVCYSSRYIFHVDLHKIAGKPFCPDVFVRDLFRPIFPHETLLLDDLSDGAYGNGRSRTLQHPMQFQCAQFFLLAQCDDLFLDMDRRFFRVGMGRCRFRDQSLDSVLPVCRYLTLQGAFSVRACLCRIDQRDALLCDGQDPSQTLFLYRFCHTDSHIPSISENRHMSLHIT